MYKRQLLDVSVSLSASFSDCFSVLESVPFFSLMRLPLVFPSVSGFSTDLSSELLSETGTEREMESWRVFLFLPDARAINEEAFLLGRYFRVEKADWVPRIAVP